MEVQKCEHCGLEINEYVEFCPGCGEPLAGYRKAAGFWIRLGAYIIDALIFIPFAGLSWWNSYHLKSVVLLIVYSVVGLLYKPLMEAFCGATLGKMACKIRVIDGQGKKLSVLNAYVRFLPFLAISAVSLVGEVLVYGSEQFQAARTFQDMAQVPRNMFLNAVSGLLFVVLVVDCVLAAFTNRKRALHDMMAESYCVYKEAGD